MKCSWQEGNRISLLVNGDEYYPAVFKAIDNAKQRVILETFIWFEDDVGKQLHSVLLRAARRGVKIEALLDGYGSPDLSDGFVNELTAAGVVFRYYDPGPRLFGMRTNLFRRMHRKIVVVDEAVAFVGGINYSAEHMSDYGPEAKQDYAIRIEGPVVQDIVLFELENLPGKEAVRRWWKRRHRPEENRKPGEAQALFVWRDNGEHRDDIERHYLKMLANAKREVIIANAYFFPGYRLLHAMRNAARRGVRVKLIVQGEPDMPIVKVGARLLYNYLVKGGVQIYEYRRRPLHGKVALMDDHWATVGSSNLDPLSLSLNLEANLIIHDRQFNQTLRDNLQALIVNDCVRVDESMVPKRTWWNLGISVVVFHFLRHFPAMVGWLPAHTPKLAQVDPQTLMSKSHPRWRLAKKILTWVFFIAVAVLLVVYAQKVDWEEVWKVIRNYNRMVLLGATGLVIVSYLMYGCYDLLGRAYCGHKLAKRQVMLVSFICYAFNLTLSTWVGGIGMRYRLYSRLGLPGGTITRIFSLSITTNWLGYILLGGVIFTIGVVQLPAHWYIDEATLRILGIVLLLIIAFYLWACAFAKRRHMTLRGQKLVLPSWKFAMLQMAVSSANWMAMGAIIWLLIGEDVNYFFVLGVLLVSSIAGVIVHIPAGIGVLEAVFIALLAGEHVSQGAIIAALLAYRMLYYFLPLALATVCYLVLESRAKKLRAKNERMLAK